MTADLVARLEAAADECAKDAPLLREAASALRSSGEAVAWRPIAEAPRDGAVIDLWDPHWGERLIGYQRTELSPVNVFYEPAKGFGGRCVVRTASHFMFQPTPPTSTKGG